MRGREMRFKTTKKWGVLCAHTEAIQECDHYVLQTCMKHTKRVHEMGGELAGREGDKRPVRSRHIIITYCKCMLIKI